MKLFIVGLYYKVRICNCCGEKLCIVVVVSEFRVEEELKDMVLQFGY